MTEDKREKLRRKLRILVAPLDWGLGHATRCIPIIKELLGNDCDVWIAAQGAQEALLRSEFPYLAFLPLPAYNIHYSKTSNGLVWKMILQMPRMISSISAEHKWLRRAIRIHEFDLVISDNRFGLYDSNVPSIFITHQLTIKGPFGKWNERVLQKWNYKHINRFTECWIPDVAGGNNLAGVLSHPLAKPRVKVEYVGPLSRFEQHELREIKDQLLFVLSGPEPQRTILENKIISQVSHYRGTAVIVRGLPSSKFIIPSTGMIKFYNHLPARDLNVEIEKADWVISRSGYSTIMDLAKLEKKSILIPTPGQTEQEYLADILWQRRVAFRVPQKEFNLDRMLEEARKFNYRLSSLEHSNDLQMAIKNCLESVFATSQRAFR